MGEHRDRLGEEVGGIVVVRPSGDDVGGGPGFVERLDRVVEQSVEAPAIALDGALEFGVNGPVAGIDAIRVKRREAIERAVERPDRPLDAAIEPRVEGDGTKRLDSHVAGEKRALAVEFDRETAVIGLMAGRVEHVDRHAADVVRAAVFDPDVDRVRREEVAVAFERFDGHLDRSLVIVARQTGACRVPRDDGGEIVAVAREPLADPDGRVDGGVGRCDHGVGLADVVDVGMGEDELVDLRELVIDGCERLAELAFAVVARHAGIDERRPLAVDEIARDVAGWPVDVELDAVDGRRPLALGHYPRESRGANKRDARLCGTATTDAAQ